MEGPGHAQLVARDGQVGTPARPPGGSTGQVGLRDGLPWRPETVSNTPPWLITRRAFGGQGSADGGQVSKFKIGPGGADQGGKLAPRKLMLSTSIILCAESAGKLIQLTNQGEEFRARERASARPSARALVRSSAPALEPSGARASERSSAQAPERPGLWALP